MCRGLPRKRKHDDWEVMGGMGGSCRHGGSNRCLLLFFVSGLGRALFWLCLGEKKERSVFSASAGDSQWVFKLENFGCYCFYL